MGKNKVADSSAQAVKQDIRLDAWRGVFQKTNRILSEEPVTVSMVDPRENYPWLAEVPAWTDGLSINFNLTKVKEMIAANDPTTAVLRLKGLNYHELCHVLYTPRQNDELVRQIKERANRAPNEASSWMYAFNALEDQRIETWFSAKYWVSRRYFEAIVLEWIITHGNTEAAILIYGRKYLTSKIRVQAGRVFKKKYGKRLFDEFKSVIDEYITLVLPTDTIKAMRLITRYRELLAEMQQANGNQPLPVLIIQDNGMAGADNGMSPSHDPSVAKTGRVMAKPGRGTRAMAEEMIEDAIDADTEAEEAEDGEDDDKAGAGGNDPNADATDSSGGGGAAGKGHQATGQKDIEHEFHDLMDAANEGLDEVREDDQVQSDVDDILDAVGAAEANGRLDAVGEAATAGHGNPTDKTKMASRKVYDILSRIRQEAEPETLFSQMHGRLDPRRWVTRLPHEIDVFKTWAPGNEEETAVEAVMLVDVSGSMSHLLDETSLAVWAMKRAFDRLDIRATVLTFSDDHAVLYQPSEKSGHRVRRLSSQGGTDPRTALVQAERILIKSHAPNKVLVTLTDGQWNGADGVYKPYLKNIHRVGTASLLLGLNNAKSNYGKHFHHEGHDISSVSELPKAVLKLVANMMRRATV